MSDPRYREWRPDLLPLWQSKSRGRCIFNTSGMNLAFVVNLRCGTCTVRQLIKPWEYIWTTIPDHLSMLENCRVIAIVREPFGRFVSSYERMNTAGMKGGVTRAMPFARLKDPVKRFEQFVRDVDGWIYDFHLIQQSRYIEECGVEITDWLVLKNLTKTLCNWAGMFGYARKDVIACNVTKNAALKRKLRSVLMTTPKLRAVVERMYADDFPLYERVRCLPKR